MKKDLLIVAHRIPYPPNKGDKIRTYNIVKYLAERYRVTLVCMIDDPADLQYVGNLEEIVHQLSFKIRTPLQMKIQALTSLVTGRSFTQQCFYSKRHQKSIDDYFERNRDASVLCFCSSSAEYLYRSRHTFSTLQKRLLISDLIDVDSEKWRQYAEKHGWPMCWLYRREARLLLPLELKIVDDFDRAFLVSNEEKAVLAGYGPVGKVESLANGVDLDYFSMEKVDRQQYPIANCRLVFSGAMDYWPNVEGAVWFAKSIFPLVRKVFPQAVFSIAGRNPTKQVLALGKIPGVEIIGRVDNMRDHLATAVLCVVPLLIARGIQNKVLEAMAMGKTVVVTSRAMTGTRAINGEEIVVADDEATMANAINSLLSDHKRRLEIGRRARAYVEREHSWESQLVRLDTILQSAG